MKRQLTAREKERLDAQKAQKRMEKELAAATATQPGGMDRRLKCDVIFEQVLKGVSPPYRIIDKREELSN